MTVCVAAIAAVALYLTGRLGGFTAVELHLTCRQRRFGVLNL
jgi:hypothetical protein